MAVSTEISCFSAMQLSGSRTLFAICRYFLHCVSSLDKVVCRSALSSCECRQHGRSDICASLTGLNACLSALGTFINDSCETQYNASARKTVERFELRENRRMESRAVLVGVNTVTRTPVPRHRMTSGQ